MRARVSSSDSSASDSNLLDALFFYDYDEHVGGYKLNVRVPYLVYGNASESYRKIYNLYQASLGIQTLAIYRDASVDYPVAASFGDSLRLLRAASPTLNRDEKLLLLSMAGARLSNGYDYSLPNAQPSFEQVFQNARDGGKKGGTCSDIHSYLAEYARALGFQSVGVHSFLSREGAATGHHVISHFRDPATGEYYFQNYTRVVNSHQKTLTDMVDVSTRVFGVLSEVSYVQSPSGKVRTYVPRTTRWVEQQILGTAEFLPGQAVITAKKGNMGQTVAISVASSETDDVRVKGFFIHSDYDALEGPYQVDAFGFAIQAKDDQWSRTGFFSQVGKSISTYFGSLRFVNPFYFDFTDTPSKASQSSLFAGGEVKGYARIDNLTGALKLEARSLEVAPQPGATSSDSAAIYNRTTPQLSYRVFGPLRLEAERSLEFAPRALTESAYQLSTVYDKFSVVVDSRGPKRTAYVLYRGEAYVFDGAQDATANGLRNMIKGAVPTKSLGEFSIVYDASKIMNNPKGDPFFDVPPSVRVTAGWMKDITKNVQLGSDVGLSNGNRPFFYFEQPGQVTPAVNSKESTVVGDVWVRFRF